jgi:hypothetical protein
MGIGAGVTLHKSITRTIFVAPCLADMTPGILENGIATHNINVNDTTIPPEVDDADAPTIQSSKLELSNHHPAT